METIKTSFKELMSIASALEAKEVEVSCSTIRKWLLANGYKGDILIRPDVVDSLWTGEKARDTLAKTVLLIADSLRENVSDIGDIYSETCLMEEMEDIPDWKMTTCLNEGFTFCTEEYTTEDGKQTNVTVIAPNGIAWFDSQGLKDIFAYNPHTYNITVNSLIEHAHSFLPHEEIIKTWLDAFGFDSHNNVTVTLDSPIDYQTVLDGVYKDIFGTWLCKAGNYPIVLVVSSQALHSILRGCDAESRQIKEVRYIQFTQPMPHSSLEAESVLVRVYEKDNEYPLFSQQYFLWNGHLFDYKKSKSLMERWWRGVQLD